MLLLPLGGGCGAPKKALVSLFLLMFFGLAPERSEGQFCYLCDGAPCNFPSDEYIRECSKNATYCVKSGTVNLVERGCLSTIIGDCFKKIVKKDCLDPFDDPGGTLVGGVQQCIKDAGEPEWGLPTGDICVCSGQLSNEGQAGLCVKEPSTGKHNSSGVMCYKCEGSADSDCGDGSNDLPKEFCSDWILGKKIWKAACFKSKVNGRVIRDCGFKIQADCRARYFGQHCTLTRADRHEYTYNKKKEYEFKKKEEGVVHCEIGNTNKISFRSWYDRQDRRTGGDSQVETTPRNESIPLVGPVSVVGALGALQINISKLPELYKDCVCPNALCNPAGHPGPSGVVTFVMVFLAAVVLNGGIAIRLD